jgi:hypothetical protein
MELGVVKVANELDPQRAKHGVQHEAGRRAGATARPDCTAVRAASGRQRYEARLRSIPALSVPSSSARITASSTRRPATRDSRLDSQVPGGPATCSTLFSATGGIRRRRLTIGTISRRFRKIRTRQPARNPERPPHSADHRVTHASRLRRRPGAPEYLAGRRHLERLHDNGLDVLIGDRAWRADPRFVIQPVEPAFDELPRHFATVVFVVRRRRATAVSEVSIHANTIRARNARCRLTRARFVSRTSAARDSSVTTTSAGGRPILGHAL